MKLYVALCYTKVCINKAVESVAGRISVDTKTKRESEQKRGCEKMNQERVVKAGLLGLGTVGSGVYKLVERQKNEMALKAGAGLEIQKILVHNINKKREGVDQSLFNR